MKLYIKLNIQKLRAIQSVLKSVTHLTVVSVNVTGKIQPLQANSVLQLLLALFLLLVALRNLMKQQFSHSVSINTCMFHIKKPSSPKLFCDFSSNALLIFVSLIIQQSQS